MRASPARRALVLLLTAGALAASGAACSRFTGSGDDDAPPQRPAAPPSASAAAAPASTVLAPGTYTVNKAVDTSPGVVVTKVTVDASVTKLDFKFTNQDTRETFVTISKPGTKDAMFLEQPDGRKISLLRSSGIAVLPAKTKVSPGQAIEFTLEFGPLDAGVRKFNVYEGEGAKTQMPGDTNYWVIHDLEVK